MHLSVFYNPAVCFCLRATLKQPYSKKLRPQSRYRNNDVVYSNQNMDGGRAERLAGACLPFACVLISTFCRAVLTHCVWSTLVRAVEAKGHGGVRCCLFDFIFQHRSALLIIKPDYENILET